MGVSTHRPQSPANRAPALRRAAGRWRTPPPPQPRTPPAAAVCKLLSSGIYFIDISGRRCLRPDICRFSSPELLDRIGEVGELDVVGTRGAQDLDHDPLPVRNRERMGLRTGPALVVVAADDVVAVAEPRLGDRAVARDADAVFDVHQRPVGSSLERDPHGLLAVALDRSRHERTVVAVIRPGRNLQLDTVLFKFVVAVLVAFDLGAVEIPAVEKSVGIVLRIDIVKPVVLPGVGAVFAVDGVGNSDRNGLPVAGNAHRVVVVTLQAGQGQRLVRIGQAVGGHDLHGQRRVDADREQADHELFLSGGNGDRIGDGRGREVSQGVDRTRRRQDVGVGLQHDLPGRLVGPQSERDFDARHQRFEREVDGQHGRGLIDAEGLLPDVRVHEIVVGEVRRAVGIAPRVFERLVHGIERCAAVVRVVGRCQGVGADGHVAGERGGRARLVGRKEAGPRHGAVVEEHGDPVALHPVGRVAVDGGAGLRRDHLLGNGDLHIRLRIFGRGHIAVLAACAHADCGKKGNGE